MKGNPSILALLVFLAAIAIHMAVVKPLSASLLRMRSDLSRLETQLSAMELAASQQPDLQRRINQLEATNALQRAEWLVPMLNSYAMRVKSILDTEASEMGLVNVEYDEGELRALPLPPGSCLPERRTGRRTVKVRALADYAAIASFLLRVEKEHPALTLQALSIKPPKTASPERHDAEFTFEWPCRGEMPK